jgi:hypothetical protein
MSRKQQGDRTKPEFGQRGRDNAEPVEAMPTSLERLQEIGRRWWGKKAPQKKKDPRALGFRRQHKSS